jgi:hypothetical protein
MNSTLQHRLLGVGGDRLAQTMVWLQSRIHAAASEPTALEIQRHRTRSLKLDKYLAQP